MAQRQIEHIVDSIRVRRHRIGRALGNPQLPAGMQMHMRRHPLLWMLGGTALGAVAVSMLVPILLWSSRGFARRWVRNNVQASAARLALAAVARVQSAAPKKVSAIWENAASTDQEPPLQASGGPVQPLSTP